MLFRSSKKINRELDSRPSEQELGSPSFVRRCLECVPRRKNDGLMVVSDQGTTNKSQRSYSVKEEVRTSSRFMHLSPGVYGHRLSYRYPINQLLAITLTHSTQLDNKKTLIAFLFSHPLICLYFILSFSLKKYK